MPTKNCNIDDVDEKKEDSSWPENGYANHPQNGVNSNDEEDDDDLFEDNVWNNLSNENHDDNQQNGFHQDNVVDDNEINSNEYILLSQDENAAVNNNNGQRRQYYRHDYQVEWLETNEQLFFGSSSFSFNGSFVVDLVVVVSNISFDFSTSTLSFSTFWSYSLEQSVYGRKKNGSFFD